MINRLIIEISKRADGEGECVQITSEANASVTMVADEICVMDYREHDDQPD